MSLFSALGNARGHRLLASVALPRRRVKRLPAERLAAERLEGVLALLSAASPPDGSSLLEGRVPPHASGARQPRHARALAGAPSVTEPADSVHLIPESEVPVSEVLASEVLASEVPVSEVPVSEVLAAESTGAGRHRRPGVPVDGVLQPIPTTEVLAPAALPGSGRHRRPGVPVAVDWAHPIATPEISPPAVPGANHPRRSDGRVASGLRRFRVPSHVPSHQLVLLVVLVLLVAVAAVLGIRGSGALASAQPKSDAASSHSATVTVPGGR